MKFRFVCLVVLIGAGVTFLSMPRPSRTFHVSRGNMEYSMTWTEGRSSPAEMIFSGTFRIRNHGSTPVIIEDLIQGHNFGCWYAEGGSTNYHRQEYVGLFLGPRERVLPPGQEMIRGFNGSFYPSKYSYFLGYKPLEQPSGEFVFKTPDYEVDARPLFWKRWWERLTML